VHEEGAYAAALSVIGKSNPGSSSLKLRLTRRNFFENG
jgi:hypothetical protein